jgi:hypothetical protein
LLRAEIACRNCCPETSRIIIIIIIIMGISSQLVGAVIEATGN